jgi:hypothetical protein
MASLDDQILANNNEFKTRIKMLMIKTGTSIVGEDTTTMNESRAEKRHKLGVSVLNYPDINVEKFAYTCAVQSGLNSVVSVGGTGLPTDPLIYTGGSTLDNDIEFTISSVWDDIAGVKFTEL